MGFRLAARTAMVTSRGRGTGAAMSSKAATPGLWRGAATLSLGARNGAIAVEIHLHELIERARPALRPSGRGGQQDNHG